MRIQHNIMAMSAYRNYTNNVSAMKKNLEKLSSGYKINRAGDDAAGLAISEKMRAQITGLETAQKNAKDGISLVQTAEGALTEVHDMLNRMVELATQSANGTYDNDTDRAQLQKEVDQLRAEIDRIADSSNFNGIKLLDGSLSGREAQTIVNSTTEYGELTNFSVGTGKQLPVTGTQQVTNTVLHVDKGDPDGGTKFSVDLHNVGFSNKKGATLTLSIGGATITVEGTGGKFMTDDELAKYIVDEINSGTSSTVKINAGTAAASTDGTFTLKSGSNTASFGITLGTSVNGGDTRLIFNQLDAPTTAPEVFDGYLEVKVAGGTRSDAMTAGFAASTATGGAAVTITYAAGAGNGTITWTNGSDAITAGQVAADNTLQFEFKAGNTTATFTITMTDGNTGDAKNTIKFVADAAGNLRIGAADGKLATVDNVLKEINKLVNAKIDELDETAETNALGSVDINAGASYEKIGHMTVAGANMAAANAGTLANKHLMEYSPKGAGTADFQWKTSSVQNVTLDDVPRLASTVFELTKEMVTDGASIKIGNSDYVFTTDKALDTDEKLAEGYIYIGDLGKDGTNLADADIIKAAQRLTTAAAKNTTYTVGNSGDKKIMVTEIEGQDDFDLSTIEGIESSLGFRATTTTTVETTEVPAGRKLTLQIGDTAESFNQLKVSIGDTHTAALGLDKISIADQDSAALAIDTIKAAINTVSDIRGTLGATQNRLDHTINNLSVMTENIQDAESTIRDTDVADEMMAYTKNNILIQSAQAMLAQANQVPQGVLQLLQ